MSTATGTTSTHSLVHNTSFVIRHPETGEDVTCQLIVMRHIEPVPQNTSPIVVIATTAPKMSDVLDNVETLCRELLRQGFVDEHPNKIYFIKIEGNVYFAFEGGEWELDRDDEWVVKNMAFWRPVVRSTVLKQMGMNVSLKHLNPLLETTFDKVKSAYADGHNWNAWRTMFAGYDPRLMARVLQRFSPYLLQMYGVLFVENRKGPAVVTAISDKGIRVAYFSAQEPGADSANWDYDWLMIDDLEIGERYGLVWQTDSLSA